MERVERYDPEGFRTRTRWGVETCERPKALRAIAGNGFRVWISPRFGLETERSEGAGDRTDPQEVSAWKRRCRPGALTLQWWRKRRCERAKGRIEIPVPADSGPMKMRLPQ
jgi:hypothetical protein